MQFETKPNRNGCAPARFTYAEAKWVADCAPASIVSPRRGTSLALTRKVVSARRAATADKLPAGFFDGVPLIHQDVPFWNRGYKLGTLFKKHYILGQIEQAQCQPDSPEPHNIAVELRDKELDFLYMRASDSVVYESLVNSIVPADVDSFAESFHESDVARGIVVAIDAYRQGQNKE